MKSIREGENVSKYLLIFGQIVEDTSFTDCKIYRTQKLRKIRKVQKLYKIRYVELTIYFSKIKISQCDVA